MQDLDNLTAKYPNLKGDIEKCSRCGLCGSVCPIYKLKRTESSLTRGKFTQLQGVLTKKLKFSKKILQNLDMCLNCGACSDFCPSEIDAPFIFGLLKSISKSKTRKFLASEPLFKLKMTGVKLFTRFLKKKKTTPKKFKTGLKIIYFEGCVSKATGKMNKGADFPFEVIEKDFECCGIPFLSKGNVEVYERAAEKNLQKIDKDADFILFDCASCLSTFKKYKNNPFKDKAVLIGDILGKFVKLRSKNPVKVTYHHPCHLKNAGVTLESQESFLSAIENVKYEKMPESDACCGMAGDFFTMHPVISHSLLSKKAYEANMTGADIILTSCPLCIWGLQYGQKLTKNEKKVMNLADFIRECDIEPF